MTGRNAVKRCSILIMVLSLFLAGASLAQEQDMRGDENLPLTDGFSEVRSGVIAEIDVANDRITVGNMNYELLPEQNEILAQIVGEAERSLIENVDLSKLRAGDRIRYAVDEMGARMQGSNGLLFVLGLIK